MIKDTDIEKKILENITKTVHLSLATVNDNKPWVCEVHFAHDDNLNLYFVSKKDTRHCREIASNPSVAGNIIRQHSLTEAPDGLYFEGEASEIIATDEDITRYTTALNRDTEQFRQMLSEASGRSMYKIKVKKWAVFCNLDGSGHAKHELVWGSNED